MKIKWIVNLSIAALSFVLLSCGGGGSSDNSTKQRENLNKPDTGTTELVINIEQENSLSGFTIFCPANANCESDDDNSDSDNESGSTNHSDNDGDDDSDSDSDNEAHSDNDSDSENEAEADNDSDSENEAEADNDSDSENVAEADNKPATDKSNEAVKNFNFRDYKFENEDVYLYLSLNTAIIDNYSLASFKENFKYLNFQIFFPKKETQDSTFYFTNESPIETLADPSIDGLKFTIINYENNKLQGKIEGTIKSITERMESDAADCITNDIEGICFKSETANIPFTINFNLAVE